MNEIKNFDWNPILKKLLIDYVLRQYEYDALINDEHLYKEYNYLMENNMLNSLFEEEYLKNQFKNGIDRG